MPIDFPNSPTINQTFTSGTTTWVWDGTAWNLQTTTTASNDSMPVGSIMWFAVSSTPTGWLPCDGTTYTNTAYPNLVAVIGTTFGGTPGTNFKVPTISATTGAYYIRYTTAVGVTSTLSLLSAPVGSMVQWPVTSSYPTGWVRCDGTSYSTSTYADLFTLIGYTYGGSGSSFLVPNISAAGAGSPVYIIKATSSGVIEPSTVSHAASHVRGGSDIIDADRAQIDYVPTTYTRNSAASEAGAVTDLTAHLSGINNAYLPLSGGTMTGLLQRDTGWNNMNLTAYDGNWTVGGGQYRKMPDGFVVFRSLVKIAGGVFFTLPVGYRPSGITYTMHLCAASGGIARIDVASNGQMYYAETKAGTVNLGDWTDLSGIRFWAG